MTDYLVNRGSSSVDSTEPEAQRAPGKRTLTSAIQLRSNGVPASQDPGDASATRAGGGDLLAGQTYLDSILESGGPVGSDGPLHGSIARAADGNAIAPGAQDAVSAATRSSGDALPGSLRGGLEGALGADLSGVRVHTGGESQRAAQAIGAQAWTLGQDVHFGAGHFDPGSTTGQGLIAHEVAHTVQQRGAGTGSVQEKLEVSAPGDAHELEAERFAERFMAGGAGSVTPVASSSVARAIIQRDPGPAAAGGGGAAQASDFSEYTKLQGKLATFTEGPASLGPLELTAAFVTNDATVPEHVKFGPGAEMTRILRMDQGVQAARELHAETGATQRYMHFGVLEFARETLDLSLTTHMLGSYNVQMADTPDGQVLFVVSNDTSRQSGTRNPLTGKGASENKTRAESEWFGTIHQLYYWTEPRYVSLWDRIKKGVGDLFGG